MRGPKPARFTVPWTWLGPSLSARSPTLTKSKRPAEKAFSSTAFKGYYLRSGRTRIAASWVPPLRWTLFGPYTSNRRGPLRTCPERNFNRIDRLRPPENTENALEIAVRAAGVKSCSSRPCEIGGRAGLLYGSACRRDASNQKILN